MKKLQTEIIGVNKIAAILCCGAMLLASLSGCGNDVDNKIIDDTAGEKESEKDNQSALDEASLTNELTSKLGIVAGNSKDGKDEIVYVFTDASGKQTKVLVNEKLNNGSGQKTITDSTSLKDIENLTGDETYEVKGSDIVWNAEGNSITYQGTTDEILPITMSILYELDGKKIEPNELAGKSGHVKIYFEYKNNTNVRINVGDKEKNVKVPFTAVTGLALDADKFSNVEAEHGKVQEQGNTILAVGVVMPGLKESLDITIDDEELDIDLPEDFTVEADVVDFEIDMIMTAVNADLISVLNVDDIDKNKFDDDIDELTDATKELIDGVKELKDGTQELKDNMPKLTDGAKKIDDGVEEMAEGVLKLEDGARELNEKTKELYDKVNTELAPGIEKLANGTASLGGLSSILTDTEVQKAIVNSIAKKHIEAANSIIGAANFTSIEGIQSACNNGTYGEEGTAALTQVLQSYKSTLETVQALPSKLSELQNGTAELARSVGNEADTKTKVKNDPDNEKDDNTLHSALYRLADGTGDVRGGTSAMREGIFKLREGTIEMKDGVDELADGADELNDGVQELLDGVNEYDEEGIQKLKRIIKDDLTEASDTFKAVTDLGKEYTSFAGKRDDMEGTCVFIIKADGITLD